MRDASFFRQIARQCGELMKTTRNPELRNQLEQWAIECDRKADRALRTHPREDILAQARRHEMRAAEYLAVADQLQSPTASASFRHLSQTYAAMARRLQKLARAIGRDRQAG